MDWFLFAMCGIAGGVLGGMGMGGGTVLIPLLSILFGLDQHLVQAVNLISFIPMSAVALYLHIKNKLVEFKHVLYIVVPGVLMCAVGSLLAKTLSGEVLRKCFGGFLLLLSIFYIINFLRVKRG